MGKHPQLDQLDALFEKGTDFQLTDRAYEEKTGAPLPMGKSYIMSRSALAKRAKAKGFSIVDVKEQPIVERIIFFSKETKT